MNSCKPNSLSQPLTEDPTHRTTPLNKTLLNVRLSLQVWQAVLHQVALTLTAFQSSELSFGVSRLRVSSLAFCSFGPRSFNTDVMMLPSLPKRGLTPRKSLEGWASLGRECRKGLGE